MKVLQLIGRALEFPKGQVPRSILYLPKGKSKVVSASANADGTFPEIECNVTRRSAIHMEAARQTLVAQGKTPFTDYCHEGILGNNDRKSGMPTRFWWDDNRGVMGDHEWTEPAEKALTGKLPEFDAFSPHVPIGDSESPFPGEALGLYQNCGGLVNIGTFGRKVKFSESADMQQLVAADPNLVAQVDAALRTDTQPAAEEKQMKELIAKLCAAFSIKPDGKADTDLEKELLAAFEKEHTGVAVLTARAGALKPVIVAVGLSDDKAITEAELIGALKKQNGNVIVIADDGALSFKPPVTADELVGKEVVEFAVSTGILAPAEKEEWLGRFKRDRAGWQKELIGKTPSVLIGKLVKEAVTTAATTTTAAAAKPKWETRMEELIAKDPAIAAVAKNDLVKARSLAVERIAKDEPALLVEQPAAK